MDMPTLSIDGTRLHYDRRGSGQRHIILLHAYPTCRLMWEPQLELLARDRTVIACDVRGFGLSDAPDDPAAYSPQRSVADVLAIVDHLGLERTDLLGLSMGGNIALNFALAHPARVSALIVSGTGAGSDDAAAFAGTTNAWADSAERGGMDAFAETIMANPIFGEYADRGAAEKGRLRALILANRIPGVAHTARQVLAKRPTINSLVPRMQAMPAPTLVVIGERDAACVPPARVMVDALPDARFASVPGTGHFNNLEEPAMVNAILGTFLDDVRRDDAI